MKLTGKLLTELQRRLKIGNRRGVHLNAIPSNSRYKFDFYRLSHIDKNLPDNFIKALLSELPLKFRISWKDNVPDLNSIFEDDQIQLVRITKAFENLINQTEAIESEKGINTFGFGFPILARRDRVDNKLTVAPILIWSLRIKRTKEFNTWEILRNEDDPIYINEVLINHLQSDSNIEIEQIPSNALDDGLINNNELINICANLVRAINTITPEDLEETFKKKLGKITAIGDKAHYEKLPLNSTNAFIDFSGLFSIFEVQKQNIIEDYDNLMELEGLDINLGDIEGNSFQPISSIETDPSQQSVLHSLETTRNVLIQGPPGTGKSQTLSAVLINALENNKKTIIVCEKRTALEVLHNALIEKGLNYHCVLIRDIIKDRKTVVDSVRERIDNSEYKRYIYNYSKESLDTIIEKANRLITIINNKHQKLDKKLIGNKSWSDVVGDLLAQVKGNTDDINLNIEKKSFKYSTQELNSLIDVITKGQALYSIFLPIESTSFINSLKLVGENPYLIEENINNDYDAYLVQLQSIKALLEANKSEFVTLRNEELKSQIKLITDCIESILVKEEMLNKLLTTTIKNYQDFRITELTKQIDELSQIIAQIEGVFNSNKENSDLTNDSKINSFAFKFLSIFSKRKKQTIYDHVQLHSAFTKLEETIDTSKDFLNLSFNGALDKKRDILLEFKSTIINTKNVFDEKIKDEFLLFKLDSILIFSNSDTVLQSLQIAINDSKNSEEYRSHIHSIYINFKDYLSEVNSAFEMLSNILAKQKDIKLNYTFIKTFFENKDVLSEINGKIELIKGNFDSIVQNEFKSLRLLQIGQSELNIKSLPIIQEKVTILTDRIKGDNWTIKTIQSTDIHKFIIGVEALIQEKTKYFESDKDLFSIEFRWFQFYNGLSDVERAIINELKTKSNWKKAFLVYYLNSMLVNSATDDLPKNDEEHKELDVTLNGVEKEHLKFIKEFWYSKQIDATREFEQNNYGLTVGNLYLKKQGSKNIRLSLRQIVQKDADLFTTFFPIILTSPDVASNLFKGMNGYFDIVMFDEASQLRLEDNLPAILKGKQIIIAGDEHQMPPSNYFSKVFDGSVEDEEDLEEEKEQEVRIDKDDILLSCDSLLDFGSELNFQRKHLDFHYRSRHPFLIDFSNYAFYNQRLKPIPNNFEYVPIKYIKVDGTFSEHTNEAEAEMVLSIIENNIHRLPDGKYPTLGVATFNIAQRNLIKSKILERAKFSKFDNFNAKIIELEENGMFIKNLENIQGDERDVIILSTTYGIGKDNKFAHRFGPINHSKGYKLLNVIITRAKFKIYCCTSIPEQVFMNYKEYLNTEGANNKRAVLYAYLAYCKAISESNNELRISVLTSLAENTNKSVGLDSFRGGDLESPFEEEVYQSLVEHFGSEKLITQLQFAGFRIDIVYDPKIIGIPKIAIECDGAKYHSSREAYLYDRHRQKILENHGFVFHRIWSTNWWRNSKSELAKLISFIKNVESSKKTTYIDNSKTASAFTDEILNIEDSISESFLSSEADEKIINSIELEKIEPKGLADVVKLNSKVLIKYLNNGKELNVYLVETEDNKNDRTSKTQRIYIKSPLANSLLGQSVGAIVKIGGLDNFVEIIKIVN